MDRHSTIPRRACQFGMAMLCMLSFVAGRVHAATDPSLPPNFLAYPPYSGFTWEATHLLPRPKTPLPVVNMPDYMLYRGMEQARPKALQQETMNAMPKPPAVGKSAENDRWKAQIQRMRSAPTGEAAYAMGKGLPEAVRLYTAGAVDFHRAQPAPEQPPSDDKSLQASVQSPLTPQQLGALGRAIDRFQAVLDLSPAHKSPRALAAAYMLGRCYALRRQPDDLPKAVKAFELTRLMVHSGLPDPEGLAVASFGEEARYFRAQGDLAKALQLYASQASHGSVVGVQSLKWVAQALYQDPHGMTKVEDSSIGQRMLLAFALQVNDDGHFLDYTYTPGQHSPIFYGLYDPKRMQPILRIAKSWPPAKIAWPDRLAALAFRAGDRKFARRLLVNQHSALAWWLRAKLQVADGKLAAAEASYRRTVALIGMHSTEVNSLSPFNGAAACSEMAQLERVRGQFIQAIRDALACTAKYGFQYQDNGLVEYLADRVLTTGELMHLVEKYPISERKPWLKSEPYNTAVSILHSVLAKRLVREGRFKEAIHYADPTLDRRLRPDDPSYDTGLSSKLKTQAELIRTYANAKYQSVHADADVIRAQGWYQLALLTRMYYGNIAAHDSPMHGLNGGPTYPGISSTERRRLKQNYTGPDQASLVWYIARDDALQAAKLVPARSQAYAAILCHAAHWMFQAPSVDGRDPVKLYAATYRLYLQNGAYVSWGRAFGRRCPDPDFAKAAIPDWLRILQNYAKRAYKHPFKAVAFPAKSLVWPSFIVGII